MNIDKLKTELDEIIESIGSVNKNTRAKEFAVDLLTDLEDVRNKIDSMSPDRESILCFIGWLKTRPYPNDYHLVHWEQEYYTGTGDIPHGISMNDLANAVDKYLGGTK